MRTLLASLILTALVATAALADDRTVVAMPRFVPAAGPVVVAPDRLAWVTRRDDRVLDLWVSQPGGGPRRVQRFSGADTERLRSPRLTVSPSVVGLRLRVTDRRGRALRTLTYSGAFGEPLRAAETLPAPLASPGYAAWVARGCESAEIRTLTYPSLPVLLPEPTCELRLRSPLRLRGDRLRLGISCAGFEIDCSARVIVRAAGRVIARGTARYNHTTPPYAAASLRVGQRSRRLLRSGRPVRVTARIDGLVTRHTTIGQVPAARR